MRFLPLRDVPLAHGPAMVQVIRDFYNTGRSVHSPDGTLLAPLLNHLRDAGVPYTLRYVPRGGYYVERGATLRYEPPGANDIESLRKQQEILRGTHAPTADAGEQTRLGHPHRPDFDAEADHDAAAPEHHPGYERTLDAMGLIDILAAHLDAVRGTDLSPEYVRITQEQWESLKPYAHREAGCHTICGKPVEILGSPEDLDKQTRGVVGFRFPTEAIAPKE